MRIPPTLAVMVLAATLALAAQGCGADGPRRTPAWAPARTPPVSPGPSLPSIPDLNGNVSRIAGVLGYPDRPRLAPRSAPFPRSVGSCRAVGKANPTDGSDFHDPCGRDLAVASD